MHWVPTFRRTRVGTVQLGVLESTGMFLRRHWELLRGHWDRWGGTGRALRQTGRILGHIGESPDALGTCIQDKSGYKATGSTGCQSWGVGRHWE